MQFVFFLLFPAPQQMNSENVGSIWVINAWNF